MKESGRVTEEQLKEALPPSLTPLPLPEHSFVPLPLYDVSILDASARHLDAKNPWLQGRSNAQLQLDSLRNAAKQGKLSGNWLPEDK